MDEAHDSIRVMTVHGAKGLEAPIVFLPDTTTAPTAQIKTGVAFDQNGPVLVQGAKHDDARARAARDAFVAAQAREANRLLYVAMTRARDRLIVCGAQSGNGKDGRAKGCWHELVQTAMEDMPHSIACETPFGEGKRYGAPVLAQATATLGRKEMHAPAWAKQAPRAAPLSQVSTRAQAPSRLARADMGLSPRRNGKDRLQRGALVHGLLQRLPDVAPHEREAAALRWLQHQGLAGGAAAKLTREALAVMTDGQFASVFGPGSRAEAPFSAVVEGGVRITGQIDRLIVAEESIVCVDFKTDRPSPKAAEHTPDRILAQMAGYRAALGAIFPNRSITCVIIWTEGPHAVVLPSALLDAAWQTVRAG
jgi:ATP-dependent helicase/nuclease subunit A